MIDECQFIDPAKCLQRRLESIMTKAPQGCEQEDRLPSGHLALRRTRNCCTSGAHTRQWSGNEVGVGPRDRVAHDRIQYLDPESLHVCFGSRTNVKPKIIERRQGRIRSTPALQVCALDDGNAGNTARARQHVYSLTFMKLDPQRMLTTGAGFTHAQVTIVCDFGDGKAGTVECAGDDASRTAGAFAQRKITERVPFPTRHGLHDYVGCAVFRTWRSVERDPACKSCDCGFI
jgi:hypothetical protein